MYTGRLINDSMTVDRVTGRGFEADVEPTGAEVDAALDSVTTAALAELYDEQT